MDLFFPTYLLHFGYQLCNMSMNNFFFILPLLVPNKTGRPKYYCFPLKFYSGMTYFTRQLNGWKRWLFVVPKFGSPRSRKSAPFKIYKIFATHKICTYFMLLWTDFSWKQTKNTLVWSSSKFWGRWSLSNTEAINIKTKSNYFPWLNKIAKIWKAKGIVFDFEDTLFMNIFHKMWFGSTYLCTQLCRFVLNAW